MRFLSTTLLLGSVGVLTGTAVVAAPLRIVVVGKASDSGPAPLAPAAIEDFLRSVRIGHAGANGNVEPNSIEEITNVAAGSNNNRIALDEIMAEEMKAAVSSIPIGSPLFPGGFIPSSTPESGMSADRPRMPVPMTPEGEFEIPTTLVEEMLAEMGEAEKEMEVEAMKIKQWLEDEMINSGVTPATEMNEGGECRMLEEGSLRDRMERMNDRVRGWFGLAAVERTPLCSSLWPSAEAEMMETIVRGKKMLAPPLPIDLPLPSSMPLHVVEGSVNVATEESPRMPCHQGATRPIDVDEVRAIVSTIPAIHLSVHLSTYLSLSLTRLPSPPAAREPSYADVCVDPSPSSTEDEAEYILGAITTGVVCAFALGGTRACVCGRLRTWRPRSHDLRLYRHWCPYVAPRTEEASGRTSAFVG
ncbi:hypothetical protein FRB91_004644 [Serendipita sp. 411]|nr:hypothetical protein FRB91_004644 [Serendipita sp. 411]